MPKLSACIVCFNEEEQIRGCLEAVRFCDEIVVVDSGSTDRTREIAREFTERVIVHDWPGYIEQKNYAIDRAKHDWVLSVDADERITPELQRSVLEALSADPPPFAGYRFARLTRYMGRFIRHGGWYPDYKVRLFDRRRGRWGGVNPHDRVNLDGPCGTLPGDLLHYTYRDLKHHIERANKYTSIAAEEYLRRSQGAALLRMVLHPPGAFVKSYVLKGGFLDGVPGFVLAVVGAFYTFLKYAKLWEARRTLAKDFPPREPPDPARV